MTEKLVRENERVDDLQNGYYVIQDPEKFCFGMDAVLLSGFTKVKKGENSQVWKYRKNVHRWQSAVSGIIIWKRM